MWGAPPNYARLRSPMGLGAGVLYARALGAVSRTRAARALRRVYIGRGYPAMGGAAAEAWRGLWVAWRGCCAARVAYLTAIVSGPLLRLYTGRRERASV